MSLVSKSAGPAEVAELILHSTAPLADTCEKLANNPLGTQTGREQASATGEAIGQCNAQISKAVNVFQNTLGATAGLSGGMGMGSSSSGARQGQ